MVVKNTGPGVRQTFLWISVLLLPRCVTFDPLFDLWALVFSCGMVNHAHLIHSCLNELLYARGWTQVRRISGAAIPFGLLCESAQRRGIVSHAVWKFVQDSSLVTFGVLPPYRATFSDSLVPYSSIVVIFFMPKLLDWWTVCVFLCTCCGINNALCLMLFAAFGGCLRVIEPESCAQLIRLCSFPALVPLCFSHRYNSVFHFVI